MTSIAELRQRYEEMEPPERQKLWVTVLGGVALLIALYYITRALGVVTIFFD
jgi:hypothetical protein